MRDAADSQRGLLVRLKGGEVNVVEAVREGLEAANIVAGGFGDKSSIFSDLEDVHGGVEDLCGAGEPGSEENSS